MGRITDALAALVGKAPTAGAAQSPGAALARVHSWGLPPERGSQQIAEAYRTHPWWRAVASRVAREVASVPWHVEISETGDEAGQRVLRHAFLSLMRRPNPYMTGRQLIELTQVFLDGNGEGFWVLDRNAAGKVVQIMPVPPHWMVSTPSPDHPYFAGSFGTWQQPAIAAHNVVWFRELAPDDPYGRGTGLARALADELDTDEYAARHVKAFFYNQAQPSVMVSVDGAPKEELERLNEKWDSQHRGFWNAFKTFWTASKIEVTRLDTTFKDMDLMNVRGQLRDTIISVFGVPPETLGILQNSNRATIESAYFLLAKGVLVPRLNQWKEMLDHFLAVEFDPRLEWVYENPVPEDKQFRLSVLQGRPDAFTLNEWRALAGMQPDPDLDYYPAASVGLAPAVALAGDPEWVKSLPPRGLRKDVNEADIDRVLAMLRGERLTAETDPVFLDRTRGWTEAAMRDLGADARFDLVNPLVTDFVERQGTLKIKGLVNDTTREALRAQLVAGIRAGESSALLAKRVRETFAEADQRRAEAIARTETVGASNWANTEAMRLSGVVSRRRWVATRDGRTRETHAALDGVEAGMDEAFRIGADSAQYPGGFASAENSVNCRCTTVAVIDDDLALSGDFIARASDGVEALDRAWKAYDARLVPWERDVKAALRRGFAAQEADVLDALDRVQRGLPLPVAKADDVTNFPEQGDDKKVSLRNSQWRTFDLAFAEDLKTNWPDIWSEGGNVEGNAQFRRLAPIAERGGSPETDTEEEAIRKREAWGARHFDNNRLAGVVAQVKWLVVGTLGEAEMKKLINARKREIEDKQ